MSTTLLLRLSNRLTKRLERLASLTNRPKKRLIQESIENYLKEYGDYHIAAKRLFDKDDVIIPGSDLRKRLAG